MDTLSLAAPCTRLGCSLRTRAQAQTRNTHTHTHEHCQTPTASSTPGTSARSSAAARCASSTGAAPGRVQRGCAAGARPIKPGIFCGWPHSTTPPPARLQEEEHLQAVAGRVRGRGEAGELVQGDAPRRAGGPRTDALGGGAWRLYPPDTPTHTLPPPRSRARARAQQVWVYGNSFESVLVAVVVPDEKKLLAWAKGEGLPQDFKVRRALTPARRVRVGAHVPPRNARAFAHAQRHTTVMLSCPPPRAAAGEAPARQRPHPVSAAGDRHRRQAQGKGR